MDALTSRLEMREKGKHTSVSEAQNQIKRLQEYLLMGSLNRIMQDQSISWRAKILLQMRAREEYNRRSREYCRSSYVPTSIPYECSTPPGYNDQAVQSMRSCKNTTTALYIFDKRQHFPYARAMDIECWLWRHWFKPYVSDITLHHFSSTFVIEYDTNLADDEFHSEKLIAFHCNFYEQAQRFRDITYPEEENDGSTPAIYGPLRSQPWPVDRPNLYTQSFSERAAFVIQPLFRALFLALFYPQENINFCHTPEELERVKVQLILTGTTEGLSAPISFEELQDEALDGSYHPGATAITIRIGPAVRFIMRLEQREIAASGGALQPDVAKLRGWDQHKTLAKKFGWIEERDGNLDDLTPRSCEWSTRISLRNGWVKGR